MQNQIIPQLIHTRLRHLVRLKNKSKKTVQPAKGKVRFSIPKDEGIVRDSSFVLPFGGNKRNKVSERWKRKMVMKPGHA